jgi:hypothetical protein
MKVQKAVGAKVGPKENTDHSTIRKRPASQKSVDDGHGEGRNLDTTIQEQPTSIVSSLGQQRGKILKPPKLNINTCHATKPLGFGGNTVDNVQSSRTFHAVERHVALEASPRLAITERGTTRKTLLMGPKAKTLKTMLLCAMKGFLANLPPLKWF